MPHGRILYSADTLNDPLTIVRDFYLLIQAIESGSADPESVAWSHYRARCRAALTLGNVWGFESDRPLEQRED